MNIPKELNIATKYKIFLDVFGNLLSSSFSRGSTKPKRGETNIVPNVAVIPIWANSSSCNTNMG